MNSLIKRTFKSISSVVLITFLAIGLGACAENADIMKNSSNPDYKEIQTMADKYVSDFSNLLLENSEDLTILNSEGTTPSGDTCQATFIESNDSKYTNLTLEVDRSSTIWFDEYYRIDASHIYISRYTISEEGKPDKSERYIIVDDVLYEIKDETSEVLPVDRPDSLDLYLSFEEINDKYGK